MSGNNFLSITSLNLVKSRQKKLLLGPLYLDYFRAIMGYTSTPAIVSNFNRSSAPLLFSLFTHACSQNHVLLVKEFVSVFKIKKNQQREMVANYWKYLVENKSYKGLRYKKRLPVRGQRTRTNYKTARKLNGNI